MSLSPATWGEDALDCVRTAWAGPHKGPWCRGLWVTARERFDTVPLPANFSVRVERLDGVWRRLALHPGEGRALVVVPGRAAETPLTQDPLRTWILASPPPTSVDRQARRRRLYFHSCCRVVARQGPSQSFTPQA